MSETNVVSQNQVIEIHYTLKDKDGNVIDSSQGAQPLPYIHGMKNIVPGLEKELDGKKVGDKVNTVVGPEEAYGEIDPQLVRAIPKTQFEDSDKVQVGAQFQVEMEDGSARVVEVVKVEDEHFVLNGNHPLAGLELHFDVEIMSIRPATETELAHGHVHLDSSSCEQ